jgi:disulfide bond formation protein DsbB
MSSTMIANRQRTLLSIAVLCLLALAFALTAQYGFDKQPCAWCVLQRLIYVVIALVCLIGAAGGAVLSRIMAALTFLLGLGGVAAAWYQYSVASKLLSCDQTFADRVISHSKLDALLPSVFGIFASCMDAVTVIAGVEFSVWSLILFVLLVLLALRATTRPSRS